MHYLVKRFLSGNQRSVTVKKNIIGSLVIKGISVIISFILVPMTLGYVSSELYGIWLTLSSIMMWLNFFDIGFTLGLKNKLTEAISQNDWNRGKSLVSTTYFMMLIIFLPLCIVLEAVIPYVNWADFLNVSQEYNDEIIKTLYVLVGCFCLQMIVNVLTAVIAAFQKVALSSLFPVIGNFIALIVIFVLTKCSPPSLVSLAFALSFIPVLVIITSSVVLYSHAFKAVRPEITAIKLEYVKDLFSLGSRFFLIQIQVVILYQCTNILISNISGPNDVTAYNIAYKYLNVAVMVYSIILSPLWPAYTDAYSKKDFVWMKSIYRKMSKVFILLAIVVVLMVILSPIIYHLWVGEKVVIPIVMTICIAVYMLIHAWDSLQVQLINGIGKIKLQTYITLIGLLVHVPLSFLLGKYIGALGVVCSMIIINIVYVTFFTIQVRKLINQKASGIWAK